MIHWESRWLSGAVSQDDLNFVVNAASRYSPWAAASISKGFLTAPGGHRIGLCGEVVSRDGEVGGRVRRYYAITPAGRGALAEQAEQWQTYADGIRGVLEGGVFCGA